MLKIRMGVFETNSSSTHSLSIKNTSPITEDEDKYLQRLNLIINPFSSDEVQHGLIITDIKNKLRYLLTAYYQAGGHDQGEASRFMRNLQKVVPCVLFCDNFEPYPYVMEDVEYLFDGYPDIEIKPWIDDTEKIKQFLLRGEIRYWNRDDEVQNEENRSFSKSTENQISWTG